MTRHIMRSPSSPSSKPSICSFNEDSSDGPSTNKRQMSLTSFFTRNSTASSRPRQGIKRKQPLSCLTPPTPQTPNALSSKRLRTPPTVSPADSTQLRGASTPPTPPKTSFQPPPKLQQAFIDLGQSAFAEQLCPKCGMLYVPGVAEDVKAHASICQQQQQGILWRKSANQRVLWQDSTLGDCVLSLHPSSPQAQLDSVYQQVRQDLGLDPSLEASDALAGNTLWLYLCKQRVVGFLSTIPISHAQRSLSGTSGDVDKSKVKAMLGVSLLWTHQNHGRRGIATKLMDLAREHAFFGMYVPRSSVAFSSPTSMGWEFARKYSSTGSGAAVQEDDVDAPLLVFEYTPWRQSNPKSRSTTFGKK
eukprot:Nitzschia sp. Nitz4//scaffold85_size83877//50018//51097//NITZ4_005234-RA/size83877-processed-gene-0.124-mRNA-1//1//CDS//3329559152//1956//frame0